MTATATKERNRVREPEARILALRIAAACTGHEAPTSFIKDQVPKYVDLTSIDSEPSNSRGNEEKWRQIIGNVVSHEASSTSIFNQGYAVRVESIDGIRVTPKGMEYLKSLGY
jgi:hypothetical protein